MTTDQKPSLDDLLRDELDDVDVHAARAELADALLGRGPLPWVVLLGVLVLLLVF
jgi:hypothetical protein